MKFEKIGNSYYVNSHCIKKAAFKAIFGEIWNEKDYLNLLSGIANGEVFTVVFDKNFLTNVDKLEAELQEERKKNQLLTAKLAAVEKAFLALNTA